VYAFEGSPDNRPTTQPQTKYKANRKGCCEMSILEIISAVLLILSCVFIIVVVLMQESKRGMSQTLTGSSSDNYYQKNASRTREAQLGRATKNAAIVVFVVTLAVNIITVYASDHKKKSAKQDDTVGTSVTASETTAAKANTNANGTAVETAEGSTAPASSTPAKVSGSSAAPVSSAPAKVSGSSSAPASSAPAKVSGSSSSPASSAPASPSST
jgi:preprotein translocase subunit SecG